MTLVYCDPVLAVVLVLVEKHLRPRIEPADLIESQPVRRDHIPNVFDSVDHGPLRECPGTFPEVLR